LRSGNTPASNCGDEDREISLSPVGLAGRVLAVRDISNSASTLHVVSVDAAIGHTILDEVIDCYPAGSIFVLPARQ